MLKITATCRNDLAALEKATEFSAIRACAKASPEMRPG